MNSNSAEELKAILDSLPGMAFRCRYDNDFTFDYVSEGVRDLLGYKPLDLVNISAFRKLVHPDDQSRNKMILKQIRPDAPRYEMIYRMRTVHGVDKWVMEQGLAVYTEQGDISRLYGMLTDVTSQKIAEMELLTENRLLRGARNDRFRLGRLIGKTPCMQRVYDTVLKAAANKDTNVLIMGESGTGKELAARAIHDLSERSGSTFVAVNCGAIPENLIESEFFGHLKGAFTGASTDKKGYLEAADGGTLMLDEVGEIPRSLQIKLLRALEEKSFMPVGSHMPKKSDFRIIAATNRDLSRLVTEGIIRMDFFYRINVISIKMPPLRERKEDIPLLVEYFMERFETKPEKRLLPFELLKKMRRHSWPGNVRELKNAVERFITIGELSFLELSGQAADPEIDLYGIRHHRRPSVSLDDAMDSHERRLILQTLKECRWKKGASAKRLGISWRTLQRKLKKHAIE